MQIVYLSNRPKILLETLDHVALFMPFVDNAIVCVPDELAEEFDSQAAEIHLSVIPESEILNSAERTLLTQTDHQRRNYLLRSRLAKHEKIDAQFIMSDDDARPLKMLELERFLEGGRYHRYFFYELGLWNNNQTEFDLGQLSTFAVLQCYNLPTLSYASHMPQIIDKEIFLQSVDFFQQDGINYPLCEWSSYFNYAAENHYDRFHNPTPYMTLCWPEHPLAWKQFVQQSDFVFENYTPSSYQEKQPFSGLGAKVKDNQLSVNIEKIIRWRQHSIQCVHPEQAKSILKYLNIRTWVNKLFKHRL